MSEKTDQPASDEQREALLERLLQGRVPLPGGSSGIETVAATRAEIRTESEDARTTNAAGDTALNSAQKRMWFLNALSKESKAYVVFQCHRVQGPVDIAAFESAVAAVVARHEMLRACFPESDGQPVRRTFDVAGTCVKVIDATHVAEADRESSTRAAVELAKRELVELGTAPLFRVTVIRFGATEHRIVTAFHHIIVDGWSLGVFHADLETAYADFVDGRTPSWPAPPLAAAEIVRAEEEYLSGREGVEGLKRAVELLRDAPMIELPMTRTRPPVARFVGAREEVIIPLPLLERLESLARNSNASLYMVLVAAVTTLLHRYSGQTDILIGSPVANRPESGMERSIGLFVNSVVLRLRVDEACSVRELLAVTRAEVLRALEDQRLPFEHIVERLAPNRALSHNPIFQVMVALQNAGGGRLRLQGANVTPVDLGGGASLLDLETTFWRLDEGLKLRLTYNTDIIGAETARRLVDNFVTLLQGFVEKPDAGIHDLPLLSSAEEAELRRFETGPGEAIVSDCLHTLFQAQVDRSPHALAVADLGTELTFLELDEWANRLANQLIGVGVRSGDVVGVCLDRTVGLVAATLAVLKASAACLPLNPRDPEDRLRYMVSDAGASIVLGVTSARQALASHCRQYIAIEDSRRFGDARRPSMAVCGTDLAYVMYTSGTTGRPKGVQVQHRNIANTLVGCQRTLEFGDADVGLVLASSTFDVFYFELFGPMFGGGRSILVSREELFDPQRLTLLLQTATFFQAVPGVMEHLLTTLRDQGVPTCSNLRAVMTGGDLVPPALFPALNRAFPCARVMVTYGPTEAAVFCTLHVTPHGEAVTGHPIGRPLPGTVVRVGDASGRPVPMGVSGEIWIGGAGVARGYAGRPTESAERFIDLGTERFYRSGDRGRWDVDGTLNFCGRADRQVKVRGFRIELSEIEEVLAASPEVAECTTIVRGTGVADRRLAAYVVTNPAARASAAKQLQDEQVRNWKALFDGEYGRRRRHLAGDEDFTGWNSSLTGEPIPIGDLLDWLDGTVAQIKALVSVERLARRDLRVLEIGCGTGLVLMRLAEYCSTYVGTDLSGRALADLRSRVTARGLRGVRLVEAAADSLGDVGDEFDLVILNSVVQYMPSAEYLVRVLRDALARSVRNGFVFVGDVRSLPLVNTFHAAIMAQVHSSLDPEQILQKARQRAEHEGELLVHPALFSSVLPEEGAHAECEPRRASRSNELACYRYDVVLEKCGQGRPTRSARWRAWGDGDWSLDRLKATLEEPDFDSLALADVPNTLLAHDLRLHCSLLAATGADPLPIAKGEPVSPEALRSLAEQCGLRAKLSWLRGLSDGAFDVFFARDGDELGSVHWPMFAVPPVLSSDPVNLRVKRRLAAAVQRRLIERLPEYMVPATLSIVDAFPRSVNGKLDREALGTLGVVSEDPQRRQLATAGERLVAEAWDDVLGHAPRMANDDFFESGGTSLLAVQLSSILRARGLPVTPQMVFLHRTIERMAATVPTKTTNDLSPREIDEVHQPDLDEAAEFRAAVLRNAEPGDANARRAGRCVLLAGATGMLGVHLLHELLSQPETRVVCLIRAFSDAAASDRLREIYRWYFGDGAAWPGDRVRVVAGDMTAERLGVSPVTWNELARECDEIINGAADVRHVGSAADMMATNRDGTRRLLTLAAAGSCRFHHVSTIGVKGYSDPSGPECPVLTESVLHAGPRMRDPYSESKAQAEKFVLEFIAKGGQGTIFRVGTVAPHSISGRFQRNMDDHFFSRYVRAVLDLGFAKDDAKRIFRLVPADFMARSLVALTRESQLPGPVFHIQSPNPLPSNMLVAELRNLGYNVALLDAEAFDAAMAAAASDPGCLASQARLTPLIDSRGGRPTALDSSLTQRQLERLGHVYPKPSTSWIQRFVSFGIELGYFPLPIRLDLTPHSA